MQTYRYILILISNEEMDRWYDLSIVSSILYEQTFLLAAALRFLFSLFDFDFF